MKKGKYKICVIPSDRTGVSKFRSVDPHVHLQKLYPDEFHIDIEYQPRYDDVSFWQQYDLVHYHRNIGPDYSKTKPTCELLKKLGIPAIMDLDDYWLPTVDHPAHAIVKENKLDVMIKDNLQSAHHVTTTTSVFADEIRTFNKNVHVFPNAINPDEKQFQHNPEPSDLVRIGWLGGSSHIKDLEILDGVAGRLDGERRGKFQFVLCGYDLRGSITFIDQATGEQKNRPVEPHESVWYQYEKIFTQNYRILPSEYQKFLERFKKGKYPNEADMPYKRVWTKPITTYASNYNTFDISLAPIKEHMFNKVKSQLKVIEAGFHKKALIAQNYGPYQIDLVSAIGRGGKINPDGNCLLVDSHKNHKQWYKHIKYLIDNPSMIKDLGEKLYEDVQKYHIDVVTKDRAELYRKLIKQS